MKNLICSFKVYESGGWLFDKRISISDILPVNADGQTIEDAITNVKDGLISHSDNNISLLKVDTKYEVLDGFHRIAAAILRGDTYIIADVRI